MTHVSMRSTALRASRVADADSAQEGGGEDSASSPTFPVPASPAAKRTQHLDPPRNERAVISRTRFHITLPRTAAPSNSNKAIGIDADQRGWSSPHGEPYRPLGRPDLDLKLSPQIICGASPLAQSSHRIRVTEDKTLSSDDAHNLSPDKAKDLREPSLCAQTPRVGASMTTLVGQFVASLTSRKRPLDERQVKLAQRLQTSVEGFSPDRSRMLHRHSPRDEEFDCEQNSEQQYFQRKARGDGSMELLREAIQEGTSRLRSTRNGTSFLQRLPPTELHALREVHQQYLLERTSTAQPVASNGIWSSRRLGARNLDENSTTHCAIRSDIEDSQSSWYLPYTTRQLQRSPHKRLPSLQEFQARARDDKQPLRPAKANPVNRMRANTSRSARGSLTMSRTSVAPNGRALNFVGGQHADPIFGSAATAGSKSPFPMATNSLAPVSPMPPMHSVEKLQAAIAVLQTTKHQQSVQLATTLEVLQKDRRECLAGKFRNLHVQCDAGDDLRRMREQSERHREQRVIESISKTADWYPELLRRLLTREINANNGTGTTNAGSSILHAAELFVIRAVCRITNDGCEFQPMQLYQVVLHLHHEDLKLIQLQQLLEYLRNSLHISYEDWEQFFASHNIPGPITEFVDYRKDAQAVGDGKSCFTPANTTRASAHPASSVPVVRGMNSDRKS